MMSPPPANFERSAAAGAEMDDLDRDALDAFLKRRAPQQAESRPPDQLAASLGLLAIQGNRTVPTVAGMLLFGRHPQLSHPEWGLAAVRVRGKKMADPLVRRADIEGNLPQMLDDTLAFCREQTQSVANLVNPQESEPEYPETAVREALLNALVHRDYRMSGRATLRIFDDRLEVWSPGGMPVQFSLEHLAQHGGVSFPRNPVLASSVRFMGLMDQVGRGLTTIRRALSEVCPQTAQFGASQSDFLVLLPSRIYTRVVDTNGN